MSDELESRFGVPLVVDKFLPFDPDTFGYQMRDVFGRESVVVHPWMAGCVKAWTRAPELEPDTDFPRDSAPEGA